MASRPADPICSIPEASTISFVESNDFIEENEIIVQMWSEDPSAGLPRSEHPASQCPPVQLLPTRAGSFCLAQDVAEYTAVNKKFSDDLTSALELVLEDEADQRAPHTGEEGFFKVIGLLEDPKPDDFGRPSGTWRLNVLWSCCAMTQTGGTGGKRAFVEEAEEEDEDSILDSLQSVDEQHEPDY